MLYQTALVICVPCLYLSFFIGLFPPQLELLHFSFIFHFIALVSCDSHQKPHPLTSYHIPFILPWFLWLLHDVYTDLELETTHERKCAAFVFLGLGYLTQHSIIILCPSFPKEPLCFILL